MSYLLQAVLQFVRLRWWLFATISAILGLTAACLRVFESNASREKRVSQKKKKELRALVNQISTYGQSVRRRFPDGAVVVSEEDLAAQLRKRPESVIIALNVLLNEQKVQRTKLDGYWRLNA